MLEVSTSEHPYLETCTCCCTKFIIGKNDIKEYQNGNTKIMYFRCPVCNTANKISLDDNTLNTVLYGRYSEFVDIVEHDADKVLVDISW